MDDRSLFRFKPGYRQVPLDTVLDWSEWGGFAAAVEMCNNNGACRARDASVMCPSFRATGDEQHLTRGRANTLRLALTGQLGPEALVSEEMRETMDLCISCKGCKRECPTGVDMARMKIEFLHHYRKRHSLSARDRLIAYLPRYAPYAARIAPLLNLRNRVPALAALGERLFGLSAKRRLPSWSTRPYAGSEFGVRWGICGAAHLTLPPLRDGSLPLPPQAGGEGHCLRRKRARGRIAPRHLQPLFRAGERTCGRAGLGSRRLSRDQPRSGKRQTAVLRADFSFDRSRG
jgi:Fe-S oxidoreductase